MAVREEETLVVAFFGSDKCDLPHSKPTSLPFTILDAKDDMKIPSIYDCM